MKKKYSKKSRSPARVSCNTEKKPKKRSALKNSKKAPSLAMSTKISEAKPDSEYVPVINCNLQGFGISDSETKSLRETLSKAKKQKKDRPVYFKSTLSSQRKIEKLSLLKRKTKSE